VFFTQPQKEQEEISEDVVTEEDIEDKEASVIQSSQIS